MCAEQMAGTRSPPQKVSVVPSTFLPGSNLMTRPTNEALTTRLWPSCPHGEVLPGGAGIASS